MRLSDLLGIRCPKNRGSIPNAFHNTEIGYPRKSLMAG